MAKESAGILVYRICEAIIEVLLVHPGGPFFARKDVGAWSIPKGELEPGEDPFTAAKREFFEESGQHITGDFHALLPVKQKGGKVVHAWAIKADLNASTFRSNTFSIEWPPKSGKTKEFHEIDKAEWFSLDTAKEKINNGQIGLIDQLELLLKSSR